MFVTVKNKLGIVVKVGLRKVKSTVRAVLPDKAIERINRALQIWRRAKAALTKRWIAKIMPIRHRKLLKQHRGARPIRVLFLVSNTASWKVGPVFERMLKDTDFEPIAAICAVKGGLLSADKVQVAELVRGYLVAHGFPFIDLAEATATHARQAIAGFDPHIVFFTNPHALTESYLHRELYLNRLSCYVPYNHEVMTYANNQEQYNQESHNAFWRIYVPHDVSLSYYESARIRKSDGVLVTGFPACETLIDKNTAIYWPWKSTDARKKRIIYAPHWLVRDDIKMATIDEFGHAMMCLAEKFKDHVQWAFRPHPMLKTSLMSRPNWGTEKAEEFFDFWEKSNFSQFHDEDYIDLFKTSDAMIHDSGSFLAEYLYLQKPVMYLVTEDTACRYLNPFGERAVTSCEIGRKIEDIERFILRICSSKSEDVKFTSFYQRELLKNESNPPSRQICESIKSAFSAETIRSDEQLHK